MSQGLSFMASNLTDEQETDGITAADAVRRLASFKARGIGLQGANKPFFLATGYHKPHLPHIVPQAYFDLYDVDQVIPT